MQKEDVGIQYTLLLFTHVTMKTTELPKVSEGVSLKSKIEIEGQGKISIF